MSSKVELRRRRFFGTAVVCGFAPAVPVLEDEHGQGLGTTAESETTVPPTEYLMREHGGLRRILLLYEAGSRRLSQGEDMESSVFVQAAETMRDFIHDYHEKLEEDHLFPHFRKAGRMVPLVDVLIEQHAAGRKLTEKILQIAPTARTDSGRRKTMIDAMQASIVLYQPHAAREDTDIFPTVRSLVVYAGRAIPSLERDDARIAPGMGLLVRTGAYERLAAAGIVGERLAVGEGQIGNLDRGTLVLTTGRRKIP